ncbi:MAG TPA: ATP-binding protein [Gaiellaceae bacterium]
MGHPHTTVVLTLRDEPEATRKLRTALAGVVAFHDLPEDSGFELQLAATEAVTNAIKGAPEEHAVEVTITGSAEGVDVEVTDGRLFSPQPRAEGVLEAEGGQGIPLMLALVDEVQFASIGDGTRVRIRKRGP